MNFSQEFCKWILGFKICWEDGCFCNCKLIIIQQNRPIISVLKLWKSILWCRCNCLSSNFIYSVPVINRREGYESLNHAFFFFSFLFSLNLFSLVICNTLRFSLQQSVGDSIAVEFISKFVESLWNSSFHCVNINTVPSVQVF